MERHYNIREVYEILGTNLAKKYLLDMGGCVVYLLKGAHNLHVEWFVTIMKRGVEAQPVLTRPTTT